MVWTSAREFPAVEGTVSEKAPMEENRIATGDTVSGHLAGAGCLVEGRTCSGLGSLVEASTNDPGEEARHEDGR